MKVQIVTAISFLLSAAPVAAEQPSLEHVAANARARCEMKQHHIPAGKTVTAPVRNCVDSGRQAKAVELARRDSQDGGMAQGAAE